MTFWTAPRLWPGETVCCLGSGPSLTAAQCERARGRARVIACNDSWRLAPWADVLYGCDWRWWRKHAGVPAFAGVKVTISNSLGHLDDYPDINVIENTGTEGLDTRPNGIRTGRNSGYQAINLAVHMGAALVVLLGYDMKAAADGRLHFFGDHEDWPTRPTIFENVFVPQFKTLLSPLRDLGVEVVNCTPDSALTVFHMKHLDEMFS